jgi:hypothetical protein
VAKVAEEMETLLLTTNLAQVNQDKTVQQIEVVVQVLQVDGKKHNLVQVDLKQAVQEAEKAL